MYREIEIKLKVENLDGLERKLTQAGCVFAEPISQFDVIYSNDGDSGVRPNGKAEEGHLAIRIRREGDIAKFTLKQQKSNEMDNLEYETKVDDAEAIHKILEALNWKPQLEVKKVRKKGMLGEYEICLDRVEGLGEYLEIEKMTNDNANPEEVRKELFSAIKPFGLTEADEETRGYDTLIYQLNNK